MKVKTAAPGRYGDGDGLYLLVRDPRVARKSGELEAPRAYWLFRYTRDGKMREIGLGRARGQNAISLADAREKAAPLHRAVRNGRDPLADREALAVQAKADAQLATIAARTFREAVGDFVKSNGPGWRNAKHKAQWSKTLETYVYPHFGSVAVAEVATPHVLAALEPIWHTKAETASRVRGRIESVLSAETARGTRTGENPARWRGHLDQLLPRRSKVAPVEHHAALPYADVPSFMLRLQVADGIGARALEFLILTAARTEEVLGATWAEIDLAAKVWTVPPARMKAGREHRVPLSSPAVILLQKMATLRAAADPGCPVFPGAFAGKGLSNMAMTLTLRRLKRGDITVHGFRSTFRDWAAEQTSYPNEVAELCLAHAIKSQTEAAYRRGDQLEKRRELMGDWATFCSEGLSRTGQVYEPRTPLST